MHNVSFSSVYAPEREHHKDDLLVIKKSDFPNTSDSNEIVQTNSLSAHGRKSSGDRSHPSLNSILRVAPNVTPNVLPKLAPYGTQNLQQRTSNDLRARQAQIDADEMSGRDQDAKPIHMQHTSGRLSAKMQYLENEPTLYMSQSLCMSQSLRMSQKLYPDSAVSQGNGGTDYASSIYADNFSSFELLEILGNDRAWSTEEMRADSMLLDKYRLRTVRDLRSLSNEGWNKLELVQIVKDILRVAIA